MGKWFAAVAAVVLATGCKFGAGAFTCTADTDCTGSAGGRCEPNGLCSFSDDSCGPGGQRYGGLSGDKAGQCVGGTQPSTDAGIDTPGGPPPDALVCYGTGIVKVCFASAPTQSLPIVDQTLDTSDPTMCATTMTGGDNYCVVVATTISISGTLRATGSKPLVLIGSDSISITGSGLIEASSRRTRTAGAPETGAGADATTTTCVPGAAATNRGGGAGGSFTGTGGTGGTGAGANAGTAGMAATPPITVLRGGCPGQDGQNTPGSAGHGGGAVYLIAGNKIDIAGQGIFAGGEGGGGGTQGPSGGGGGGGGAGGMIGLDAPTVALTGMAALVANGGGGGEGGSGGQATAGENGTDGITTAAARGGNQNTGSGGDGGSGSAGAASGPGMPGVPGTNNGGGGGGGGGAGVIKVPTGTNFGNKASPTPS